MSTGINDIKEMLDKLVLGEEGFSKDKALPLYAMYSAMGGKCKYNELDSLCSSVLDIYCYCLLEYNKEYTETGSVDILDLLRNFIYGIGSLYGLADKPLSIELDSTDYNCKCVISSNNTITLKSHVNLSHTKYVQVLESTLLILNESKKVQRIENLDSMLTICNNLYRNIIA